MVFFNLTVIPGPVFAGVTQDAVFDAIIPCLMLSYL